MITTVSLVNICPYIVTIITIITIMFFLMMRTFEAKRCSVVFLVHC